MRLYIMRHGPAEDRAGTGRDFDRALTAPGRDRVRDVAQALFAGDEGPKLIVSSPLVRALETAEIVRRVVRQGRGDGEGDEREGDGEEVPLETSRELAPDGDGAGLVRSLIEKGAKRVMLVGHEPDLSDLATRLSDGAFRGGFDKAMVVGLATAKDEPLSSAMRLRFVLEPKSLKWLQDAR